MSDAFRIEGLDDFAKALESFAVLAEADINRHVRSIAYNLTYSLVMETPQYSGAAASAWRVGIGSPELVTEKPEYYVPGSVDGQLFVERPYSKRSRNMQAVYDALMACSTNIAAYTVHSGSLYISNGLDYTQWFEQGEHAPGKALRAQNLPQRTVDRVVQDSLNMTNTLGF